MQIFVKLLTNKTVAIEANSIAETKQKIMAKVGVPVDQQCLIYAGKPLDDDKDFAHYNILSNSSLDLVLKPCVLETESLPPFVKVSADKGFVIYNLEAGLIPNADLNHRIYRSAIMSGEKDKILCLAPSKSLPSISDMPPTGTFVVNEIIEGTMMNLFFDGSKWELATKKKIGGNNFFFRNSYGLEDEQPQKTFRQMFCDVLNLETIPFDRTFCYSFVLQHPSNHIVTAVRDPKLYLVQTYKLDGLTYQYVNPKTHPNLVEFLQLSIKFPREFVWNPLVNGDNLEPNLVQFDTSISIEEIEKIPLTHILTNPQNLYISPGLMITNQETGFRTALHNEKYLEAKVLRGNNPNLHYQYLMLRKVGKVGQFLHYFPMYKQHFNKFLEHFGMFRDRIQRLYWDVHVKKTVELAQLVDTRDRYFVEKLHFEVFLPEHKVNKKFYITKKEVEKFLDRENIMIPLANK